MGGGIGSGGPCVSQTPTSGEGGWGGAGDKAGDSQHPLSSLDRSASGVKITHMNGLLCTLSLQQTSPHHTALGSNVSMVVHVPVLGETIASCVQPSSLPTRAPLPIPQAQRLRVCPRSYSFIREGAEFKVASLFCAPISVPLSQGPPHPLLGTVPFPHRGNLFCSDRG